MLTLLALPFLLSTPLLILQLTAPIPAPPAPAAVAAGASQLDTPEAIALADKVQKFYEKTNNYTADFNQVFKYSTGRTARSTGIVRVKKPGLIRWDYTTPDKKLVVLDKKANLYLYADGDNEAQVKKHFSSDGMSAAVTFLWGKGKLTDSFHVALGTANAGESVLNLVPKKPENGFKEIYFTVDPDTGAVQKSVIIDTADNKNSLTFLNAKTDSIDPSQFEFNPPKGTHITEFKG